MKEEKKKNEEEVGKDYHCGELRISRMRRENNKIVEEGMKKIEEGNNNIVEEEEGNKNEKGEG